MTCDTDSRSRGMRRSLANEGESEMIIQHIHGRMNNDTHRAILENR